MKQFSKKASAATKKGSAAMVQPGYYKGKELYGSFDYYYVVDFEGDDEHMWGNYTGPRSLYWGINLSAGYWVEAGELFVDDMFHASPRYIGKDAPEGVPPFHGDLAASESDQDRMFKEVIEKAATEHPEYFADK
ncbi:MAG: hypothetical protein KF867_08390 [Cryobacterium sp.]|nr:hypothetical protein [Cryobacterium sp.]